MYKNTRMYDTELGRTQPDFTDIHCGFTGCRWEVFESKNIQQLNWGSKQFLQYTKEALVAGRSTRLGNLGRLNIIISMDSTVNARDLKYAQSLYLKQFQVELKVYKFDPAAGQFWDYEGGPNALPLQYRAGAGWQFGAGSGADGDAADADSSSDASSGDADGLGADGGGGGE